MDIVRLKQGHVNHVCLDNFTAELMEKLLEVVQNYDI